MNVLASDRRLRLILFWAADKQPHGCGLEDLHRPHCTRQYPKTTTFAGFAAFSCFTGGTH